MQMNAVNGRFTNNFAERMNLLLMWSSC